VVVIVISIRNRLDNTTSREVQLQNAVMEVDGSEPGKDI
jgi:hypothetical protein